MESVTGRVHKGAETHPPGRVGGGARWSACLPCDGVDVEAGEEDANRRTADALEHLAKLEEREGALRRVEEEVTAAGGGEEFDTLEEVLARGQLCCWHGRGGGGVVGVEAEDGVPKRTQLDEGWLTDQFACQSAGRISETECGRHATRQLRVRAARRRRRVHAA